MFHNEFSSSLTCIHESSTDHTCSSLLLIYDRKRHHFQQFLRLGRSSAATNSTACQQYIPLIYSHDIQTSTESWSLCPTSWTVGNGWEDSKRSLSMVHFQSYQFNHSCVGNHSCLHSNSSDCIEKTETEEIQIADIWRWSDQTSHDHTQWKMGCQKQQSIDGTWCISRSKTSYHFHNNTKLWMYGIDWAYVGTQEQGYYRHEACIQRNWKSTDMCMIWEIWLDQLSGIRGVWVTDWWFLGKIAMTWIAISTLIFVQCSPCYVLCAVINKTIWSLTSLLDILLWLTDKSRESSTCLKQNHCAA